VVVVEVIVSGGSGGDY